MQSSGGKKGENSTTCELADKSDFLIDCDHMLPTIGSLASVTVIDRL